MLRQGYSLSRYLERFGGWANAKDLLLVGHQVALTFDALLNNRVALARTTQFSSSRLVSTTVAPSWCIR